MPFLLKNIRGALKGVMAWVFVIVGIAAFSVVGIPSLQNFSQKPPVSVGSVKLSQNDLRKQFNRQIQRLQLQSGRAFSAEEALNNGLPEQIVADLTSRAATKLEAEQLNLGMPRSLIKEILGREESFQNPLTGEFDETVMGRILQQNQISVREFDKEIREDIIRQNLLQAVSQGGVTPRALTNVHIARQTEQREVSWLSVTSEMSGEAADPTDQELQDWYNGNPDRFTNPEFRTISIAFLRRSDFQEGLSIEEEELRKTYDLIKAQTYEEPEKRTLYQLTYDNEAEATAAISRLRDGTPFEVLAGERGQSLETATLTQTTPEAMINQAVAKVAFTPEVKAGDTIGPITGLFGSTIAQIVEITPANSRPFEDVRDEIETAKLAQETEKLAYDAVETIEEERDNGTSLLEAAQAAKIELTTFGPVDQFSFTPGGAILEGIPGIALTEAFLLDAGEESGLIELENDEGYLILTVDDITPPALRPFEDVSDEVETAWRDQESRTRINKTAQAIIERLKAGETIEEVSDSFERAAITERLDLANPTHATLSPDFHRAIFAATKGEPLIGDPIGGNIKIIAQTNDIDFNRGAINNVQLQNFSQFIGSQLNQELLEAYITTIQSGYGVEVNQDLIDRAFDPDGEA